MPVAAIGRAIGLPLIVKVLVQLCIQNALGKRLLQIVEQAVTGKCLVRVAAREQTVQ